VVEWSELSGLKAASTERNELYFLLMEERA